MWTVGLRRNKQLLQIKKYMCTANEVKLELYDITKYQNKQKHFSNYPRALENSNKGKQSLLFD